MPILISASTGPDVDAALDRAEKEVAAAVKPLLAGSSLPEFSRRSGSVPAKPTAFGVDFRSRSVRIDAGRGQVAMFKMEWWIQRPQEIHWSVQPVAPGSESMATGFLGCLLVLAGWGAYAYANLDDLLALKGRSVKLAAIFGICCMFVTCWIGFGIGWLVQTKLCRMFFGAQWRAAEGFTRDQLTPKVQQALEVLSRPQDMEPNRAPARNVEGLQIVITLRPGNVAHVVLEGDVNVETVRNLEDSIKNLKSAGTRFYVLDLERLKSVSETGLGTLLALSEAVAAIGGKVVLVKVRKNMKDMFEMVGLGPSFEFVATEDEALALCR